MPAPPSSTTNEHAYTPANAQSRLLATRAGTGTRHRIAHATSVTSTTAPDLFSHQYENEASYVSALTQLEHVYHTKNPTAMDTVPARNPPDASLRSRLSSFVSIVLPPRAALSHGTALPSLPNRARNQVRPIRATRSPGLCSDPGLVARTWIVVW